MTMILTEATRHGIAMAADSAATFENGRVLIGVQKLLPVRIKPFPAGISVWGLAQFNGIFSDFWLQENVVSKYDGCQLSLFKLAEEISARLNTEFKGAPAPERMGIHVAGFDTFNDITGPAIYHVHNSHGHVTYKNGSAVWEGDQVGIFNANRDVNPKIFPEGEWEHRRNGDFSVFALLFEQLNKSFCGIKAATGLDFPSPSSLKTRGEYVRFWISTVKSIYRLSDKAGPVAAAPPNVGESSIGGAITVLTISQDGIEDFYSV